MKKIEILIWLFLPFWMVGCVNNNSDTEADITTSENTYTESIVTEPVIEEETIVTNPPNNPDTIVEEKSIYYFRSYRGNWQALEEYNLLIHGDYAYIELELFKRDCFKIADAFWHKYYEYGDIENMACFSTDQDKNFVVEADGIYLFKVVNYQTDLEHLEVEIISGGIIEEPTVDINPDVMPPVENPSNVYYLNEYGDYVYGDESFVGDVETEYQKLSSKVIGDKNAIFQTSYESGLLALFDINNEIRLSIVISSSELAKLNQDHYANNRETYRKCDLIIQFNGLVFYYKEVGIRQKGNTSRGEIYSGDKINLRHYKLNFAETFDDEFTDTPQVWTDEAAKLYREDRDFFGLEKLDIRWNRNQDATYLKEYYAYEMYRANGVLAPRSNPMNVWMVVDGEKQNMGVYLGVETIDKQFIKRNLVSEARDGDLYKMGWTNEAAKLNSTNSNLFGVETQYKKGSSFRQDKYVYDLKNNKKTSTHEAIKTFIDNVVKTPVSNYDEMLKESTNLDSFISYLAVQYLLGDNDDLRGNYNNTYIYFNPTNGEALFIPTDNDRSLGATGGGGNPTGHHNTLTNPCDSKTGYGGDNDMPLYQRSILNNGNKIIKEMYLKRIEEIVNLNWMDINVFANYYKIVKANYADNLELGSKINFGKISFALDENNNLYDGWNLSINLYLTTKKKTFLSFIGEDVPADKEETLPEDTVIEGDASDYYLWGSFNNWTPNDNKYNLIVQNGKAIINITLNPNVEFKIRHRSGKELIILNVDDKTYCTGGGGDAIKVKTSGTYLIEVDLLTEKVKIVKTA